MHREFPPACRSFICREKLLSIPRLTSAQQIAIQIVYEPSLYRDDLYIALGVTLPDWFARAASKRRAEYLAGRCAAHSALKALGMEDQKILMRPDRSPLWPCGISGSISHIEDQAVCLATSDSGLSVGIDIERQIAAHTCKDVVDNVLRCDEMAVLQGASYSYEAYLTIAFCAKEAFFKMAYPLVGSYFGFHAVRILAIDVEKKIVLLELRDSLSRNLARFAKFCIHFRFDSGVVMTFSAISLNGRPDTLAQGANDVCLNA